MSSSQSSFEDVYQSVSRIEGWMTRDQAKRLWDRAGALRPDDNVVEIGSYRGRSAIMLASSAPEGANVFAIDPHAGNDRGPMEIVGTRDEGQVDHENFIANLEAAGVRERVTHIRKPSQGALEDVVGSVELLYIDGAHRFRPALDDIVRWGDRVPKGGTMLIHDSFSSIGVTLALAAHLFFGKHFRYVGRAQSMTEYRREDLSFPERLVNGFRQASQLPWFIKNLVVKAAIVARLRPLARALGSDGTWPH